MAAPHALLPPSPWITRFAALLRGVREAHAAPPRALDLACGHGRHTRWLVSQGWQVTAVDRDVEALATLADLGSSVQRIAADLEQGAWPLPGERFQAIVITNYLWRPLWPHILDALASGGVLLVETFAAGQETVGRPRRPEFLLQPGELLTVCAALRIVAYEDGFLDEPARFVQRIAAVRPCSAQESPPPRYPLSPGAPGACIGG
jgi:SAM-dependent methyltransferase